MSQVKHFLSIEEIAIVGSYASFLGFLLIATLLSYKEIFMTLADALQQGHPEWDILITFLLMAMIFFLIFVAVPTYPLLRTIYSAWTEKKWRLATMLIFLIIVYDIVLIFQMVHAYIEFAGNIPKLA